LAGQPARRRDAEWFAKIWNDLGGTRGFHLRRLHYLVVSQDPPVLLPPGPPLDFDSFGSQEITEAHVSNAFGVADIRNFLTLSAALLGRAFLL
jgi:hypothetical protein